jgi:hypothetical protein
VIEFHGVMKYRTQSSVSSLLHGDMAGGGDAVHLPVTMVSLALATW